MEGGQEVTIKCLSCGAPADAVAERGEPACRPCWGLWFNALSAKLAGDLARKLERDRRHRELREVRDNSRDGAALVASAAWWCVRRPRRRRAEVPR
jgi:hypothetical protein